MIKEYNAWKAMKQRCNNSKLPNYHNYGGRGISYCKEWEQFSNFIDAMGEAPGAEYSLERYDNELGYTPSNCYWATKSEQALNRRMSGRNKTGVTGVCWSRGRYYSTVRINRVQVTLYSGTDFFKACCYRKSWEARNA
jgi:hypothetical protein